MKYKTKNLFDLTLAELQIADWDLAGQEFKFNESLSSSRFEKLNPKPQLGEAFVRLKQQIKEEIEKRKENVT